MGHRMTKPELLKAIKACKGVRVWVKMTPEDGVYVRVTKEALRSRVEGFPFDAPEGFIALVEDGVLYIN